MFKKYWGLSRIIFESGTFESGTLNYPQNMLAHTNFLSQPYCLNSDEGSLHDGMILGLVTTANVHRVTYILHSYVQYCM